MYDDGVASYVADACKVKPCSTTQGFRPGISPQSTGSRRPPKAVVRQLSKPMMGRPCPLRRLQRFFCGMPLQKSEITNTKILNEKHCGETVNNDLDEEWCVKMPIDAYSKTGIYEGFASVVPVQDKGSASSLLEMEAWSSKSSAICLLYVKRSHMTQIAQVMHKWLNDTQVIHECFDMLCTSPLRCSIHVFPRSWKRADRPASRTEYRNDSLQRWTIWPFLLSMLVCVISVNVSGPVSWTWGWHEITRLVMRDLSFCRSM